MKTVINRKGEKEDIDLNKIVNRLRDLSTNSYYGKPLKIDLIKLTINTISSVHDCVKTTELDDQSCAMALGDYFIDEDSGKFAARIAINNLIKAVNHFLQGRKPWQCLKGVLADNIIDIFEQSDIANLLDDRLNYKYSYRGIYLLQKGYLLRDLEGNLIETPNFAKLRVAVGIVMGNRKVLTQEDRNFIEQIYRADYTHATPTLFNSGTINPQMSSCVLIDIDDSLESILKAVRLSGISQKFSAGIGISFSSLRSKNSLIHGTNGKSSGLPPLAELFDRLGYYVDQGGGKRSGSISPYIADWHADLLPTLNLRKIKDTSTAEQHHKLYYAVWMSDLFYEKFMKNEEWYFFSPSDTPDLVDLHGEEFEKAYNNYVEKKLYRSSMPARLVGEEILRVQAVSGVPYIVNKDNINFLRNQNHVIRSSNLCVEVTVPTNEKEVGVCNLASISFKKYTKKIHKINAVKIYTNPINKKQYGIDYERLEKTVRLIVRALDRIIDVSYYPLKEAEYSNKKRRPMGIGVMGLADALCKAGLVFGSDEACEFRANFQEAIYYFAVDESCNIFQELTEEEKKSNMGGEYEQYKSGQGILHPILFKQKFPVKYAFRYDWDELAKKAKIGMRHSVLTCCMPTGSTANIMGNSACFEPYESNIYRYSAFAKELIVFNKYLRRDLIMAGILGGPKNNLFLNRFISQSGRVSDINLTAFGATEEQSYWIKKIYRVAAFEISPKEIIDMAAAAQPFIDQSQSMNLWTEKVSINTFNYYNYARKLGIKSSCYYLKSDTSTKDEVCKNCVI